VLDTAAGLLRIGHPDDPARNPATGVADRLAPIVYFGVNADSTKNNRHTGHHTPDDQPELNAHPIHDPRQNRLIAYQRCQGLLQVPLLLRGKALSQFHSLLSTLVHIATRATRNDAS